MPLYPKPEFLELKRKFLQETQMSNPPLNPTPTPQSKWILLTSSNFWTFISGQVFGMLAILNYKVTVLGPWATWVSAGIAGLLAMGVLHSDGTSTTVAKRLGFGRLPNHLRD